MVILRPVELGWIAGAADDPTDLCAHGHIHFQIDVDELLTPEAGSNVTVSAAALYLLRTLSKEHSKASPVGDHLFPCCGMGMYDLADEDDVAIVGCPNGEDFEVLHEPGGRGIIVRSNDGREWSVTRPDWQAAVFEFADRVSDFYASCASKTPAPEDAAGFQKFAEEWRRRRGRPFGASEHAT